MSGWVKKRFWKQASVVETGDGFGVALDVRTLKTPAKADLIVPSRALALAIAAEWDAVEEKIDPRRMPVTRSANAAIDKVSAQHDEVADLIAAYGGTDLLCYRAERPQALIDLQTAAWDPYLDWAAQELSAPLSATQGVVHQTQPRDSLERLTALVHGLDAFELTAVHDLVSISGSLILGLAVARGRVDAETAWPLSRVDEDWQAEQWGIDDDAAELAESKRQDFLHAERFLELLRSE